MYKIKLNQIREILGIEVSLEKIILVDGTELFTEKIEVGYPVYDAENKPVAMGEYKLFDGSTIMTDEMGVITEIVMSEVAKEAETETPEAPVEVSIEASAVEEAPAHDPMQLVYETLSELGSEIASLKESVKMFSKAPAATPIKKTEVEEISVFSKLDKLKQIKNQLKK
jgi:hypothetical protein